jgi:pullulanase/glycogen debranching enzyme
VGPVDKFRDVVKALHRAGSEVILDVVFNHTAEGNHDGPTVCFRGIDNRAYYVLGKDRPRYANYSGTGNTLNANHPIVRRMIVDRLRYWVEEMHVDGFWHGVKLNQPDWSDHSHSVAPSAELPKEAPLVHFIFNAYWEPLDFELPRIGTGKQNSAPEDIMPWQEAPPLSASTYRGGAPVCDRSLGKPWRGEQHIYQELKCRSIVSMIGRPHDLRRRAETSRPRQQDRS